MQFGDNRQIVLYGESYFGQNRLDGFILKANNANTRQNELSTGAYGTYTPQWSSYS
jgi:hypothetical protein